MKAIDRSAIGRTEGNVNECVSSQSADSTARRRSAARAVSGLRSRPETTWAQRAISHQPASSSAILLRQFAALCASSASTINSASGGTQPMRQTARSSPMDSTSAGVRWNDRHSSPQTW